MSDSEIGARENEEDEGGEDSSSAAGSNEEEEDEEEEDEGIHLTHWKILVERIHSLQIGLKPAFSEYRKQFREMRADLVRAKRDNKGLAKRNKKLVEELKIAKTREESTHKILEQTKSELLEKLERAKELEESTRKDFEQTQITIREELKRAKQREESTKNDLEQTRNKMRELCTTVSAVLKEECDKVCNQQENVSMASQLSKKRKYVHNVSEVNDFFNCPICMESCTETGEHNTCFLSCGHFFGKSCITQWILRYDGLSTCPICSRRVTLSDIRGHYASQIYDGAVKLNHAN